MQLDILTQRRRGAKFNMAVFASFAPLREVLHSSMQFCNDRTKAGLGTADRFARRRFRSFLTTEVHREECALSSVHLRVLCGKSIRASISMSFVQIRVIRDQNDSVRSMVRILGARTMTEQACESSSPLLSKNDALASSRKI